MTDTITVRVAGEDMALLCEGDKHRGNANGILCVLHSLNADAAPPYSANLFWYPGNGYTEVAHALGSGWHPTPQAAIDAAIAQAVRFAEALTGSNNA